MRFTILGCGSSPGVPRINGDWGACNPSNAKNRRRRSSLLVEKIAEDEGKTTVVIDTGPDFRQQMVDAGVKRLDGVVYTHAHADHIHGIDDLRGYWIEQRQLIQAYADTPTAARLREAFGYIFERPANSSYPPICSMNEIAVGSPFKLDGPGGEIDFQPLAQIHGSSGSLAFRINDFAYCSDVSDFPSETVTALQGLDVLILDALQYKPHPSHFSLDEALYWVEQLKPKRTILTHMHTPLDYDELRAKLPERVEPAYDGLVIELA